MVQRYEAYIGTTFADDGDYVIYEDYEKVVETIKTFPDVHICTCNCEICVWFRTKARPIIEAEKP